MFALKFLTPLFGIYLWCLVGFWTSALKPAFVHAITTKSSPPVIVDNSSNSSQFVQIRSSVNQQPTRAFVVQQKNSLSPVQQTHILDDVQKNQRVHYQPSYTSGAGAQPASSVRSSNTFLPGNNFLPNHPGFDSAVPNDYSNFNSLSPSPPQVPPLQTLVLSPQQSLPTSPSFVNEYFPSSQHSGHRQLTASGVESPPNSAPGVSSSSSQRIPFSTASGAANVNNVRQPSSPAGENFLVNRSKGVYPSPIRYLSTVNSTSTGPGTGPGSAVEQYPKYEPTLSASSFLPTGSKTKTYHIAKDIPNGGVSHPQLQSQPQSQPQPPTLVEKPKYVNREPITSDKFIKEVYLKMNPEVLIAKDRQKFFQQLLEGDKNKNGDDDDFALASSINDNEDANDDDDGDQIVAQNNLGNIRNQFEKELLRQLKQASGSPGQVPFPSLVNNSGNVPNDGISEFRLPNGQKVQISKDYNRLLLENDENADTIIGGNSGSASNKIKAIVVKQFPSTTSSPSKTNLLEELTKGVVPVGAEFEVIKRNKDGALEEVSKLPQNIPQKKVTFVILEEQPDGTVKVQGVRGSEKESLKESGEEVDTIIKKIKEGELKLPPSTRLSFKQSSSPPSAKKHSRHGDDYETKSKRKSTAIGGEMKAALPLPLPPSFKRKEQQSIAGSDQHFIPTPIVQAYTTPESSNTDSYPSAATTQDENYQYYSSPSTFYADAANYIGSTPSSIDGSAAATILNQLASSGGAGESWNRAIFNSALSDGSVTPKINPLDNFGLFHLNNSGYIASLFSALKTQSQPPPVAPSAAGDILQSPLLPTTLGHQKVHSSNVRGNSTGDQDDTYETAEATGNASNNKKDNFYKKRDRNAIRKNVKKLPVKETRKDNEEEESSVQETKSEDTISTNENSTLSDVLKKEGFYAMARFLRQSGLDSILNDTGPFTLFIPTDKAFRTLLIQLGGPDKAEEKFKENPRLLSGLLLHHVIPGAFRVNSLQDEMTGVSLAGTQLRVNTYTTHDIEWNDITVVTVNGAKILDEKDIVIPQGIAHAIDRVMFPLPVGNLLQSLQADRENRYSNFLKILEESELSYLLTGGKTFTLFAPLNRAFTHAEFTKILADANESKSFVLRHLVPGALYSAGMKYYQVRDSMEDGQQITLYKEAGKIKVNNAHVVTRNIPATNGVIHAIDAFL